MDSFLFVNGGITQVCFFLYKENYRITYLLFLISFLL
mgnify:CR=1 FL=1